MPNNSSQRRTQFSSCDACRRSRVACDASKLGHQIGESRWTGSCSRCSLKKRLCTFEGCIIDSTQWINNVKRKPSNPRQDVTSHSSTTETAPLVSCDSHDQAVIITGSEQNLHPPATRYSGVNVDITNQYGTSHLALLGEPDTNLIEPPSSLAESADVLLMRWSDQIFHHGFETIFGLFVGRNGCPLVDNPMSEVCIPATKLFKKLDADLDDELDRHNQGHAEQRQERDHQIDQTLRQTIRSFAARWLPLVSSRYHLATNQVDEVIRDSWRSARKDMLKVANRTSYRSALTLYLFAQTPIPVGISEDEELNGISGLMCIQSALLQVQRLRERQRSDVSTSADAPASPTTSPSLTQAYLDFESRAYWAAVMWDTASSLTLNCRTSLTSGLNGGCSEPAWRLARSFIVGYLQPKTEFWRTSGFEVSDGVASQIITAAAVCKLYVWKNITSLKEALREGVAEENLLFVWGALLDSIEIFNTSIRPLLSSCERRLYFLDQLSLLGWYEVNLQYYLGILTLANTLETVGRSDLLSQMTDTREDAEYESFNVLKFGIENTYTIRGFGEDLNTTSGLDPTNGLHEEPITASLVAIDPYPNRVVDSVLLMNKVIICKYRQGKIKDGPYSYLSSILLKALGQLPQSSKTVQAAQKNLHRSL
ncbi:hypothetical protein F5B20DRAFT_573462 [Whalleya microplaca]|nr:hypothetical protein F5B20DRAFT_573462 [Whalleya microplaca]